MRREENWENGQRDKVKDRRRDNRTGRSSNVVLLEVTIKSPTDATFINHAPKLWTVNDFKKSGKPAPKKFLSAC